MAKRLKLRISKAVSSSFHSCRSKDPSIVPQNPVPNIQLITVDHFPIITPPPPISKLHHTSSFKRHHVSVAPVTSGGRCSSRNGEAPYTSDDSRTRSPSQELKWKEEDDKCQHVVRTTSNDTEQQPSRKTAYSSVSDDSDNDDVLAEKNKRRNSRKKKISTNRTKFLMMMSTTSSSSVEESGTNFSNEKANWDYDDIAINNEDEEDETETLVSSSSKSCMEFSNDSSSDFSQELETAYETTTTRRQKKIGTSKRRVVKHTRSGVSRGMNNIGKRSSMSTTTSLDGELPSRLSMLKNIIPRRVEGKVKESFAILKKSEDPYEDFKSSMMEMILEKQMYEKNDLEQLLRCFLSLNAKHYHGVIVEAFSEIWKTLFASNHN